MSDNPSNTVINSTENCNGLDSSTIVLVQPKSNVIDNNNSPSIRTEDVDQDNNNNNNKLNAIGLISINSPTSNSKNNNSNNHHTNTNNDNNNNNNINNINSLAVDKSITTTTTLSTGLTTNNFHSNNSNNNSNHANNHDINANSVNNNNGTNTINNTTNTARSSNLSLKLDDSGDDDSSLPISLPPTSNDYQTLKQWNKQTRKKLKTIVTANKSQSIWYQFKKFICCSSAAKKSNKNKDKNSASPKLRAARGLTSDSNNNNHHNNNTIRGLTSNTSAGLVTHTNIDTNLKSGLSSDFLAGTRSFRKVARQHTKAIANIKAMKAVVNKKIAISPRQKVAKLMKLDAFAAEQERLRLEAVREAMRLELIDLENKQKQEEDELAAEIDADNKSLEVKLKEMEAVEQAQLKQLNKLEASETLLNEHELTVSPITQNSNDNHMRLEMLRIHQKKRLELKLKRLNSMKVQHYKQQQLLQEKLNEQAKLELDSTDNNELNSKLYEDSQFLENELESDLEEEDEDDSRSRNVPNNNNKNKNNNNSNNNVLRKNGTPQRSRRGSAASIQLKATFQDPKLLFTRQHSNSNSSIKVTAIKDNANNSDAHNNKLQIRVPVSLPNPRSNSNSPHFSRRKSYGNAEVAAQQAFGTLVNTNNNSPHSRSSRPTLANNSGNNSPNRSVRGRANSLAMTLAEKQLLQQQFANLNFTKNNSIPNSKSNTPQSNNSPKSFNKQQKHNNTLTNSKPITNRSASVNSATNYSNEHKTETFINNNPHHIMSSRATVTGNRNRSFESHTPPSNNDSDNNNNNNNHNTNGNPVKLGLPCASSARIPSAVLIRAPSNNSRSNSPAPHLPPSVKLNSRGKTTPNPSITINTTTNSNHNLNNTTIVNPNVLKGSIDSPITNKNAYDTNTTAFNLGVVPGLHFKV